MKIIKKHIEYVADKTRQQFKYMVFFSLVFTLLSVGLKQGAEVYFMYFDNTQYYTVEVPVLTDKKVYTPCSDVNLLITRNSLIDSQGEAVVALTLVQTDGLHKRVERYNRHIVIKKAKGTVVVPFLLPCQLTDGQYYFEGNVKYTVRGIQKNTHYYTDIFSVKNDSAMQSAILLPIL